MSIQQVALKYRLGEVTVCVLRRPMVVRKYGLGELLHPGIATEHPPLDLPAGAAGALEKSRRVEGPQQRLQVAGGWIRYVPYQFQRYYTDLSGSFADYMAKFSSKTRSTLRKKARRLEEVHGRLECRSFRTPPEMRDFHRVARDLSTRTYQERLLGSGLPATPQFTSEMEQLAAQDGARAYLLYAGGDVASYLYCPVVDGVLVYAYLGYDPRFREHSPGTVLQLMAFERLFAEQRFSAFDFTEGEGEHKRLFATGSIACADIYWLRGSIGNRTLVASHSASIDLSAAASRALEWMHLKQLVKSLLRFGWRREREAPSEPA